MFFPVKQGFSKVIRWELSCLVCKTCLIPGLISPLNLWYLDDGTIALSSIPLDHNIAEPPTGQNIWDEISSKTTFEQLLKKAPNATNKARNLDYGCMRCLGNFVTLMDDNSLRVAMAFPLG
ncbi:hypothetical protein EVAR_11443_1 [Eumeta japonica]|uniref:Uncharacterized protein n=1 Tax=Eumeta variegata TaxID=151549 RepID=A0A4C1TNE0_EUMVA|nr:hypothetical protein EVAR_11443_1 [Eumeta japonica]